VLATGLTPILCVGEKLEERQSGRTQDVVREHLETGLEGVSTQDAARVVIAYEPVWAIGTGVVATPDQAEEVHADLRRLLASRYNDQTAAGAIIQYGGSVKPDNAAQLLGQKNIDGFLVGGASLKADSFLAIVGAAK
jgi:triosephosphate isomerase